MRQIERNMRVAVLGDGSLGSPLVSMLRENEVRGCTGVGTLPRGSLERTDWTSMDILVEAAGAGAAREWIPAALNAGVDVLLCSCGVLADDLFLERCIGGAGRIVVPAGAVGGLDLIAAAARAGSTAVRLTTTKRSDALSADLDGEIFRGTAREAALAFPRTSNVAVTVGLAVGDLDAVEVVVRADPTAVKSSHVLDVESEVGQYRIELTNAVLPASMGRTSTIALWSIVNALENRSPASLVVDACRLARRRT